MFLCVIVPYSFFVNSIIRYFGISLFLYVHVPSCVFFCCFVVSVLMCFIIYICPVSYPSYLFRLRLLCLCNCYLFSYVFSLLEHFLMVHVFLSFIVSVSCALCISFVMLLFMYFGLPLLIDSA